MLAIPRALLLSLLLTAPAVAAPPTPDWLHDGKLAFDALVADQAADYRAMDEAFLEAQAKSPDDVALAIAHCDLFWHVWDIEGLDWAGEASTRHKECLKSLEARMPEEPEVQVLLAERDGGEARERAALALWEESAEWPAPLRARLAKVLSEAKHLGDEAARFAAETAPPGDAPAPPEATPETPLAMAVAQRDREAALALFEFDPDDFSRSGRDYFSIVAMDRWLAFSLPLLPFTFLMVLVSLVLLVAPLPALALVHYRGLARRVAGRAPEPVLPGLGLRHAWYGLAVCMLFLPTVMLGIAQPTVLGEVFMGNDAAAQTLTVILWSTAASLLALLPTLYWLRRPQWTVVSGEWRGMLGRVLAAYLVAFAVGLACMALEGWASSADINIDTSTFQTTLFNEGTARYGFFVTLLAVGVLVPVVEEWIFRGLLLGGLAKHIHFGWANLAQATLFMLIHDDLTRFPFFLAVGLLAGWLVKRYRSLLPAVLLHIINNSVAVWLMTS